MGPGRSVALLSLSLINQVTGQEVGQRGAGPCSRTDTQTRTERNQNSGPLPPRPGLCPLPGWRQLGCLRFFLSQTSFSQLLLPHDLRVEGSYLYHFYPGNPS